MADLNPDWAVLTGGTAGVLDELAVPARCGEESPARWLGSVAILFTDQVASTRLLDELGDEGAEAVRLAHYRLLREAVAETGGREIKSTGDGLLIAFADADGAARCAVRIQELVAAHGRAHPDQPVAVRIGIHAGRAVWDAGDLYGVAVVIAKRLCEQARGGGILVSTAAAAAIGGRHRLQLGGSRARRLKGFSRPVSARALDWCAARVGASPTAGPARVRPAALAVARAA